MADAMTFRWLQALEKKPPPATRQEIPDGALTGLYLVRQPSGATSWAVRYRTSGKPRKLTLGPYPALSLADARRMAGEALRAVAEGRDPGEEKAARKAAEKDGDRIDRDLFRNVLEEFLKRTVRGKLRSAAFVEGYFNNHVLPAWGDRKIQSITRRDVIELTDGIVDAGAPYSANRVFAAVRRLFRWCVERSIVDASPCAGLRPPGMEVKRDRVLADDEIRLFWAASGKLEQPLRTYFRILLLTGQRRDEVAGMRRSEIDGTAWTVPADRSKNGEPNLVPLAPMAAAELATVPKVVGRAGYVFTVSGERPITGFSHAKARLDAAMLEQMQAEAVDRGEDPEDVALVPWRIHDLRRTAATGMARLRVPPHVIEAVLNHLTGKVSGIAAVYNRYAYEAEKREALEAWAAYVSSICEPTPLQQPEVPGDA